MGLWKRDLRESCSGGSARLQYSCSRALVFPPLINDDQPTVRSGHRAVASGRPPWNTTATELVACTTRTKCRQHKALPKVRIKVVQPGYVWSPIADNDISKAAAVVTRSCKAGFTRVCICMRGRRVAFSREYALDAKPCRGSRDVPPELHHACAHQGTCRIMSQHQNSAPRFRRSPASPAQHPG